MRDIVFITVVGLFLTSQTYGAEQTGGRPCVSVAQKLATLSVSLLRGGVADHSPILPISSIGDGRLKLTSGIEHLIPRMEGVPPSLQGLILVSSAAKPTQYAAIKMGGNGFGFHRPKPDYFTPPQSLGPLLGLQYDGTGTILYGSFFQQRDGKNHVLLVPMRRLHSGTGEVAAVPRLGAVETELPGGSLYYHIVPVRGTTLALMLKGGFDYQAVGVNSEERTTFLSNPLRLNPRLNNDGSEMTMDDVIKHGFHWRSIGIHAPQSAASIYFSMGEGDQTQHYLAPSAFAPKDLSVHVKWESSIAIKSDQAEAPQNIRFHPDLPIAYAIYKNHYEIFMLDHLAEKIERLANTEKPGSFAFDYPAGLANVEDIHFYTDIVNPSTGETTLRVAAVVAADDGSKQIIWLDDSH